MLIILLGLVIRLSVSLHSYSGQNKPPMYGDYEAQRHWMEITYNLPVKEWYFNTTDNDLMYWGLDYPPLTAYHSLVCGYVAAALNTSYVELYHSRGFESENHKHFMRFTVLVADLFTYIPAIVLFYLRNKNVSIYKAKEYSVSINEAAKLCCLLALIYPGIIIIDHGHFQYNCISLGLFVFAVSAISQEKHIIAAILFTCALTYKQMELYHALPFFFYLLGNCFSVVKKQGFSKAMYKLTILGSTVIFTLFVLCFPFLTSSSQAMQLFIRLFPIARGVFEDKVANVWCVVNIIYKLKLSLSNENMAKICLLLTCLAVIPSSYDLLVNNSLIKFKYGLVNSALSFFLFSYQVHEKSILLAAIPALLVLPYDPLGCVWLLCISSFSMFPLILKDHLVLPFVVLSALFTFTFVSSSFNKVNKSIEKTPANKYSTSLDIFYCLRRNINNLFYLSLFGCFILVVTSSIIRPPKRYPDIFLLLVSVYSFMHFFGFLVYFNIKQLSYKEVKSRHD